MYKLLNEFLSNIVTTKPVNFDVPKKKIYMKIPYFGKKSLLLKSKLMSIVHNMYPCVSLCVIFKRGVPLSSFFKFKG